MNYSPPGSAIHGIFQVRILEWVAMPSSRGLSQPRDWTQVFHIAGGFFTIWATREAQECWSGYPIPSLGDLLDPEVNRGSPAGRFFTSWATREAHTLITKLIFLIFHFRHYLFTSHSLLLPGPPCSPMCLSHLPTLLPQLQSLAIILVGCFNANIILTVKLGFDLFSCITFIFKWISNPELSPRV